MKMKRWLVARTETQQDLALLLLRLIFGGTMIPHGYGKLVNFNEYAGEFMDFMDLGPSVSLALTVFAELLCAAMVTAGLLTRLSLVPLIILCLVIVFDAHGGDVLGEAFTGFAYLTAYVALLLTGPGKFSADWRLAKK